MESIQAITIYSAHHVSCLIRLARPLAWRCSKIKAVMQGFLAGHRKALLGRIVLSGILWNTSDSTEPEPSWIVLVINYLGFSGSPPFCNQSFKVRLGSFRE